MTKINKIPDIKDKKYSAELERIYEIIRTDQAKCKHGTTKSIDWDTVVCVYCGKDVTN